MDQSDQQKQGPSESSQPSAKQRIELARGKNVPIDYFLYSCLEHERTQRAQFGEDQPSVGRWPFMVGVTAENPPADFGVQPLKTLLNRMCGWYAAQHPEVVEEIPLDHEVLNQIVPPFMKFTLDLADLVLLKTGTSLPSHNAKTDESRDLWDEIATILKESFPGYHGYFIRFLKWAFADIEPEEFEPGSCPPVGKHMPNFRAIANSQNHASQTQNSQPRHDRGGHQKGGHQNNNRGPNQGHRDSRGPRQNQHGSNQNNPNHKGGSGANFNRPRPNTGGPGQPADADIEKAALAAVDTAIERITKGETDEVFLKPMNSFYRRIQHQYAVDKGFESCSVGDGNERGVKVSKAIK
ncbi:MAG: hypothetical protein NT027_15175 [Proteobacteria bacterium]|nr:hypothetical protein [Pseudomonadota bacterium]